MLTSTVLSEFGSVGLTYNLACNDDSTGWIWVEYVLNGNGNPNDYTFKWAHEGDTVTTGYQDTLTSLEAGDYVLIVVDDVGCTDTVPKTLDEPLAIEILSESFSEYGGSQIYNISCFGTNNGSITIEDNDADRLGRYHEYSWTGPGGPTAIPDDQYQTDLVAGTYNVVISDVGPTWYCTLEDSFTLVQPPQISLAETLSDYNGFEITCADSASGWIKVDVAGGYYHPANPYTYEWIRQPDILLAENTDSVADLAAGQYQVRITDSLNCSKDTIFTLNEPPQLQVNWTPVDINGVNVSCFNDSDGAIESTIG